VQNRIEPPVLLSRLLLFVFAGCVVVVFVMFMSLQNMFPLNRPEVFFITTKPEGASVIQITELPPNDQNLEAYKQAFVMEYVRERNEIEESISIMRQKWGNNDGVISAWSTQNVYDTFRKTGLYNAIMQDYPDFKFTCNVNFIGRPLQLMDNQYTVRFEYFCTDSNGQTSKKDYTIHVGLELADNTQIKWGERLNNPLGIRVSQYIVQGGAGDPLDTVYR
jgi:type IV secretory pathway component VirB8